MTNRERAMNILHYKDADRLPAVHFGYWVELLREWAEQGKIPQDLAWGYMDSTEQDKELDRIIGWDFNWCCTEYTNNAIYPKFEEKELEIMPDGSRRVLNNLGVIERIKPGIASIPSEDDYTLKDREVFETLYKPRMQYFPDRVDLEYFKSFNEKRDQTRPVGLHIGSVLGSIRDMTSVVGMSYLMYDEDEDLFADIIDNFAEMQYQCVKAALEVLPRDKIIMGNVDPVSFKTGTPDSVAADVQRVFDECSGYGNFMISTGCDVPAAAKTENIEAYFKKVNELYS